MLAKVYKSDTGYTAEFEYYFEVPCERVWSSLVNNGNFKFWMEHLEITDLRKGGNINFHYNDGTGTIENIKITDYTEGEVLQFNWGEDAVRFEVNSLNTGSQLLMKQYLTNLTNNTPKDLAGWHVCLLRFKDVVADVSHILPENEWEKWYMEYKLLVNKLDNGQE